MAAALVLAAVLVTGAEAAPAPAPLPVPELGALPLPADPGAAPAPDPGPLPMPGVEPADDPDRDAPTDADAPAAEPAPEPGVGVPGPGFPVGAYTLENAAAGLCLTAAEPAPGARSGDVLVAACDGGSDQRWTYDAPSKRMRVDALGIRFCLSATGPSLERCPDDRSDTYRWVHDDGIYTPSGSSRRYLGVDAADDVVLAAPEDAGAGFDWIVLPVPDDPAQ
ncbi:MAG: ricin-type beta-trefoil lectin domain protein [Pseudonocardia sp.]